jgi:hypothetical protein
LELSHELVPKQRLRPVAERSDHSLGIPDTGIRSSVF